MIGNKNEFFLRMCVFFCTFAIDMTLSPLLILTLVIGIIWFVPIVCRKIHVPSIVGFILAGIVIGPSVLNLVGESPSIKILGSLGMLYIMFQSGTTLSNLSIVLYSLDCARSLFPLV